MLEIEIIQKEISIGEKYRILINGQETYKAASRLFRLFPCVEVKPLWQDTVLLSIEMQFGFLEPQFTFSIGLKQYDLETISWWKNRYAINTDKGRMEIVGHRGRKVSIFLNGIQVAWFESDALSVLSGDRYKMIAQENSPQEWLIAIMLFWDNYYNRKDKGLINFSFGRFNQSQPFDNNWQPF